MLRRKIQDIHINHERWLISYADFITLLFAFFVVMYSVSQVNEEKYEALSETLQTLFSDQKDKQKSLLSDVEPEKKNVLYLDPLPALEKQLSQRLSDLIDDQSIQISSNELWLQISLNNRILFGLASVTPSEQAKQVFADVADILKSVDNPIQVEGFTDNLAINTAQFPSNWELSSARAAAIVNLLANNGIAPERLAAVGYGEFQPIADNATKEGQALNRRVVLMVGKYQRQRPEGKNLPFNSSQSSSPTTPRDARDGLTPITLKNGEHLFTSDPDLPRINR